MVLNWEWFPYPTVWGAGEVANVWRHFWLLQAEGVGGGELLLHPVGRGQGCSLGKWRRRKLPIPKCQDSLENNSEIQEVWVCHPFPFPFRIFLLPLSLMPKSCVYGTSVGRSLFADNTMFSSASATCSYLLNLLNCLILHDHFFSIFAQQWLCKEKTIIDYWWE